MMVGGRCFACEYVNNGICQSLAADGDSESLWVNSKVAKWTRAQNIGMFAHVTRHEYVNTLKC